MIKGKRDILKNLKKQHSLVKRGMYAGVIEVSTELEFRSNSLAPRKTGFLRISSFTVTPLGGDIVLGRVGYTAAYAAYVHEMPESNNFTKPGTGPKFLEKAVKNNQKRLTDLFFITVKRFVIAWR